MTANEKFALWCLRRMEFALPCRIERMAWKYGLEMEAGQPAEILDDFKRRGLVKGCERGNRRLSVSLTEAGREKSQQLPYEPRKILAGK